MLCGMDITACRVLALKEKKLNNENALYKLGQTSHSCTRKLKRFSKTIEKITASTHIFSHHFTHEIFKI